MTSYKITLEKETCDGIFACLTRDPRFVEDDDGLATIDPDADPIYDCEGEVLEENGQVIATFDDDRIGEAQQAAAACPVNAITVTELEGEQ